MRVLLLAALLVPVAASAQTGSTQSSTTLTSSNLYTETRASTVQRSQNGPFKSMRQLSRENRPEAVGQLGLAAGKSAVDMACENMDLGPENDAARAQCAALTGVEVPLPPAAAAPTPRPTVVGMRVAPGAVARAVGQPGSGPGAVVVLAGPRR